MQDEYNELKEQVLAMHARLEVARLEMPNEKLIIEYDNGGGQSGVRENPFFKAYNALLASYRRSLETLEKLSRHAAIPIGEETPLDKIIAKAKEHNFALEDE